jgi:hypothetical protein
MWNNQIYGAKVGQIMNLWYFVVSVALVFCQSVLAENAKPAVADDDSGKYDIFILPGGNRPQVLADFDECRELAGVVQPPPAGYVYAPSLAGAAAVGFMQGLMRGAQIRHMSAAALRKCLAVKGYQRFASSKDEAKALYSGKWEVVRERIADAALLPTDGRKRLDP